MFVGGVIKGRNKLVQVHHNVLNSTRYINEIVRVYRVSWCILKPKSESGPSIDIASEVTPYVPKIEQKKSSRKRLQNITARFWQVVTRP